MDSVLSSGQNEQSVSSTGRKAPESAVIGNEDELEDNHQHLLFGGTSAPTSESTGDSGVISAVARVGETVQRARDTSGDLNFVAISGIANAAEKPAKTVAPTTDANPLPAMARTGVAATVALQIPSAENAIPAGRRSGAGDRIAIQLNDDRTPPPLIPTGIRLSEMDPVVRHNVVKASASLLFNQLATDVPGSADTRPAPVVSAATRRKSAEPVVENTTDTSTLPPAYRPATVSNPAADTRTAADTRIAQDNRHNPQFTPGARATTDKGLVGGISPLPEALGTTYGARPRTAESPGNSEGPRIGAKPKSVDATYTPEIPSGQRLNPKTAGDGLAAGALNGLPVGGSQRVIETHDSSPNSSRPQARIVGEAGGNIVGGGAQAAGDNLPRIWPPVHKSPNGCDYVKISEVPNPPNTKGYPTQSDRAIPLAKTFAPYSSAPTPQGLSEPITPRSPRSHIEQPGETNGPHGNRHGDPGRSPGTLASNPGERGVNGEKNTPVSKHSGINCDTPMVSPAGRDTRQTLNNILDMTPAQMMANPMVIKGNELHHLDPRPGRDAVSPATPLPTGIKPDATGVRPADAPKGANNDAVTGINRVAAGANDIVNTVVRTLETSLPRADRPRPDQPSGTAPGSMIRDAIAQGTPGAPATPGAPVNGRTGETLPTAKVNDGKLPGDKGIRPLEPGLPTERGSIKGVDTAAVAGSNLPGNLVKNSDPAIAGDKGPVRTADGRVAADATRLGESIARPGESIARPGDPALRTGESVARAGAHTLRAGENARTADGTAKTGGESAVGKNDGVAKSADATVKTTEGGIKSAETAMKVADGIVKTSETGVKTADSNVKIGEGGKVADVAAKEVSAQIKAAAEVAAVSGKSVEVASKAGPEVVSVQKVQDGTAKIGNDVIVKTGDAIVRDQNMVVRPQDVIANSQTVAADKGVKLSDAIVKAADQSIKVEVNQSVKLDGVARVTEQAVQNNPNVNQILANNQQPIKNDAVRNEANAVTKAGEQIQIGAQNQLGIQNQIAQNQNAAMAGRANEQVVGHGVKAAADSPVQGQRNPIADVKVDQVVADILNHVRQNGKDQQAGAKILSSLDQSNIAANQQLDPKAVLDAAAVRRILDGQGIAINPATLNTIMEGIRPTGEHAVDYALPSLGSLNLSQIISLGERLQEAVAGAGNETSEPQPKTQLQQHRTKYLVKEGDTLESIAQEKLGDARLVQLLITINRALVNYRLEGERKVAYVVPNQFLWLPTDHELDVHKKNFFGKQGKDGSVSLGISSKQNTPLIPPVSFDRTIEVSAEVSASMEDFRPASGSSQPLSGNRMSAGYEVKKYVPSLGSASGSRSGAISGSGSGSTGDSKNNKMAGNLDKVRHAGNRKSVNLDEFEYASTQVSHRQCYQVREGETLMSIAASLESMGHISMWKLLGRINGFQTEEGGIGKSIENLFAGQFIVLPTTEELNEYRLLEKLDSCASSQSMGSSNAKNAFFCVQEQKKIETPPPPALVALAQGAGGLTTVHKLSSYTRLVLNDLPQLENCFSITVETRWNGQWKPMASYECRHGQTTRHLYNKQGEIKSMELDLPPYVVKEMAREDFIRNWNAYVNSFMGEAVERFV